jgi:integrase
MPLSFCSDLRQRGLTLPECLRSTNASSVHVSTADGHLKTHLEVDWKHISIEHITIDSINEWIWKKHDQGLSWITIKNVLRTMQRVLSSFSKDKKPPFSQLGLAIPERDKPRMRINGRRRVSFSWASGKDFRLCRQVGQTRRDPARAIFDTVLLAAASGLRSSELLALRVNNIDLSANTVRVEESSDQRDQGKLDRAKTPLPTVRFCSATPSARKQCTA